MTITISFEGVSLTALAFTRSVTTTFADPTQANRLVERSANLVDD